MSGDGNRREVRIRMRTCRPPATEGPRLSRLLPYALLSLPLGFAAFLACEEEAPITVPDEPRQVTDLDTERDAPHQDVTGKQHAEERGSLPRPPPEIQRPILEGEQELTRPLPDLSSYRETLRRNAEGEVIRVYEPDTPQAVELRIGDECGFESTDGTNVSCEPGSVCQKASDNEPAFCVAAARARRMDG